jgi:hypothetical protein
MNWLVRLYPAQWRARYGEEFAAVLAGQRLSVGLVLDVVGGAIDAHFSPQLQASNSGQTEREKKMTFAMLNRCAAGGPKLTPDERKTASRLAIFGALGMAALYLVLTKLYRGAPAVQAVFYASVLFTSSVQFQMVYVRNRSRAAQILILGSELGFMYLFMLSACLLASRI